MHIALTTLPSTIGTCFQGWNDYKYQNWYSIYHIYTTHLNGISYISAMVNNIPAGIGMKIIHFNVLVSCCTCMYIHATNIIFVIANVINNTICPIREIVKYEMPISKTVSIAKMIAVLIYNCLFLSIFDLLNKINNCKYKYPD